MILRLAFLEAGPSQNDPFTAEDFLNKLFPNFWSFLINLLALVVFFVILYLLAYKPVKKFVEARSDYVAGVIQEAEEARAEYEEKRSGADEMVEGARKEADAIIEQARRDASEEALRVESEANAAAEKRMKEADENIRLAEKKSRQAIQEEIVNVAMEASKKVLGREINEKDNERLLSSFVNDVTGKERNGE